MRRALVARLARLKSRATSEDCCVSVRFGHLNSVPPKCAGKRKKGDQEWAEFEEVPEPKAPQIPARLLARRSAETALVNRRTIRYAGAVLEGNSQPPETSVRYLRLTPP